MSPSTDNRCQPAAMGTTAQGQSSYRMSRALMLPPTYAFHVVFRPLCVMLRPFGVSPAAFSRHPNVTSATSLRQPVTKEQRDAVFAKPASAMQPARAYAARELIDWNLQINCARCEGVQCRADSRHAPGRRGGHRQRVIQRFVAGYSRHRRRTSASAKRQRSDTPTVAETTRSGTTEPSALRRSAVCETPAARLPTVKASTESVTSKST
jgi:hypothetical protein